MRECKLKSLGGRFSGESRRVPSLVDRGEDGTGATQERGARRKKAHSARRPPEERRADLVLERADLAADGRLGDPEARRGTTDVALLGDGDEVADLRKAHPTDCKIETVLDPPSATAHSGCVIEILTKSEIEKMRRAGKVAAETLAHVGERIVPGMTTADIDRLVREDTARRGGKPSQLGYKGFPAAVCTSRNEVVCHGIPSPRDVLEEGDIVNVDVTTNLDGYHGDTSATFMVGKVSDEARVLVETARRCRDAGIEVIRDGARIGDIGAAIVAIAKAHGYGIVTEFGGHGIGKRMHADPHVSHAGVRGAGPRLKAGMALTVEPMVNLGRPGVRHLDDGWTVVTEDGRISAQFEHTILVTQRGFEITTLL